MAPPSENSIALTDIRRQRYKYVLGMVVLAFVLWMDSPSKMQSRAIRTTGGVMGSRTQSSSYEADNHAKGTDTASKEAQTIHMDEATSQRIYQACHDMPESFAAFTKAVHDHPEPQALTEWSGSYLQNDKKEWYFPPLDRSLLDTAFGGKRIALVGDSTIYYTLARLHQLLKNPPNVESANNILSSSNNDNIPNKNTTESATTQDVADRLATMNLTLANNIVDQWEERMRLAGSSTNNDNNVSLDTDGIFYKGGNILWRGFHGPNVELNCDFEANVWQDIQAQRPEILVVNWGTHMLFRPRVQLCNVYQWLHYEQFILERALQLARDVGTQLVLFKTTNRICKNEERMREKHDRMCNSTLTRWRDQARKDGYQMGGNFTNEELQLYTNHSILLDSSSQALNQRLNDFVAKLDHNALSKEHNMTVAIYNDHDMESCAYTPADDGIHFKSLQLPRIRLLAHTINCLWTNEP